MAKEGHARDDETFVSILEARARHEINGRTIQTMHIRVFAARHSMMLDERAALHSMKYFYK